MTSGWLTLAASTFVTRYEDSLTIQVVVNTLLPRNFGGIVALKSRVGDG